MQDTIHRDQLEVIVNSKQHAIVADAQAVALEARELLNAWAARSVGELGDALKQGLALSLRNRTKIFFDPPIVDEPIHDCLEERLALEPFQELFVGERATAGTDGALQRLRVTGILREMEQFAVVDDRQHDRRRSAAPVYQHLVRFEINGHRHAKCSMVTAPCQSTRQCARHGIRIRGTRDLMRSGDLMELARGWTVLDRSDVGSPMVRESDGDKNATLENRGRPN